MKSYSKPPKKQAAIPPHSEIDERAILGCVLLSPDCLPEAKRAGITAASFQLLPHQIIFLAFEAMERENIPIDATALVSRLSGRKQLKDAGGAGYISALPDATPSANNLEYHCGVVLDRQGEREILSLCADGQKAVDSGVPWRTIADDFKTRLESVSKAGNGENNSFLPAIIDAANFIQEKIETPPELVAGILHQGSKLVLGGGSKTFKTWALTDLALAIATGEPWLSFKTKKGRSAILNFEIQSAFFQKRIRAVAEAKHITLAKGMLDVWNLRGQAAGYASIFPRIVERVKSAGYALIILDPIYKCYGDVDENSAGAVAGLMNAIEELAVETGAAIAFGAHYSKGNQAGKESIDRISGSGVFARDPDTIVNFTRHEEQDAFAVETTLRNFPPVEPFVVRWVYPLMRRDESLDPAKLKQAKKGGSVKSFTVEMIVDCLGSRQLKPAEFQKHCADERGITRATFYRVLGEAVKTGKITKNGEGKCAVSTGLNDTTDTGGTASLNQPLVVETDTE